MKRFLVFLPLMITIVFLGASFTVRAADYFGVFCQKYFAHDPERPYAYTHCQRFIDNFAPVASLRWYYLLQGCANRGFTDLDGDPNCGGIDSVKLAYVSSHGGSDATRSWIALQDGSTLSDWWHFGNNAVEASIYAMKACTTMPVDAAHGGTAALWTRFAEVFRSGTRMILGAYDSMYSGWSHQNEGGTFATYLRWGLPVNVAWRAAYSAHHPNTMATGTNSNDCWNRLNGITWNNHKAFPKLAGGSVGYWCARWGW